MLYEVTVLPPSNVGGVHDNPVYEEVVCAVISTKLVGVPG